MRTLDSIKKLGISPVDLTDRRILLRVDFDVPIDSEGQILDDSRIKAALSSIMFLIENRAKIIILAHLGRPKGKRNSSLSLAPVAAHLQKIINQSVSVASDSIGSQAKSASKSLNAGGILMLENLRFHHGEEANDNSFSQKLAKLGEIYINDAFGASIRLHSSTAGIAKYIKHKFVGFHLQKEVSILENILIKNKKPFVLILGGSKVTSKLTAVKTLLERVDVLLVGGKISLTLLKAYMTLNGNFKSNDKTANIEVAQEIINIARLTGTTIVLPKDLVMCCKGGEIHKKKASYGNISENWGAVDLGPQTCEDFSNYILKAGCVIWSGPMGVYENRKYIEGTFSIARAVSELSKMGASTIAGGGDTAAALRRLGLISDIDFLSIAGGSMLYFLSNHTLPGIEALKHLK